MYYLVEFDIETLLQKMFRGEVNLLILQELGQGLVRAVQLK